jgi:hypothetical protein
MSCESCKELACLVYNDCTANFCEQCWSTIHKIGTLVTHEKIFIKKVTMKQCLIHSDLNRYLICVKCGDDYPLCPECFIELHPEHNFTTVPKFVSKISEKNTQTIKDLEITKLDLQKQISEIDEKISFIKIVECNDITPSLYDGTFRKQLCFPQEKMIIDITKLTKGNVTKVKSIEPYQVLTESKVFVTKPNASMLIILLGGGGGSGADLWMSGTGSGHIQAFIVSEH